MEPLWSPGIASAIGTPYAPDARHEVVIVGAGITGLSTALVLARAGVDVAVVEAGEIAGLASGGNTGKVSLLQGTTLSTLRAGHPAGLVRAYVDANRDGQAWVAATAEELGVPYTRRPAITYAQRPDAVDAVARERAAALDAGLAVRPARPDDVAVPFPVAAAVVLDDQIALDPARFTAALAAAVVAAGGTLHLHSRVRKVRALPHPAVRTDAGWMHADHIVLATAIPIGDRGLYFAKVSGMRSSCVAFELDHPVTEGMFLSADGPTRSIRPVAVGDGPAETAQLVVGGAGHPVGRTESAAAEVDELVDWVRRWLPVGAETHRWSAQDYRSHNLVPFVGTLPRSLGRISLATGYGKWGLTNGPAAALRLAAEIRGVARAARPEWMRVIGTRMTMPADLARGAAENLQVARAAAVGWVRAERHPAPLPRPAEGQGAVGHRGGAPVAVSTVDGTTRAVSAVCPHLGGVLAWNDLECTWDCPLHASRFTADGTRIEGPATADLTRLGP